MSRSSIVKRQKSKPERRAFEIDEFGIKRDLTSPELVATVVAVGDERGAGVRLDEASVAFSRSYFNILANPCPAFIAHGALDMSKNPSIHTIRNSIKSRRLARY